MYRLLVYIGRLIETIRGPSITTVCVGRCENSTQTIRPTGLNENIDVNVRSTKTTYYTRYHRAWIPNTKRSIYTVVGTISEAHRHRFDERLFVPVTYPSLCNAMLKNTHYPHLYAIHAYLDRIIYSPQCGKET